jgi:hypothetical protein
MAVATTAFTSAQRQRAVALYRTLMRTTRDLFRGDQRALLAARQETRRRFLNAKEERDPAKIDEGLDMGEQVNYILKHNVVQGVADKEAKNATYKLRFTEHTELGSNDTIKQVRPAPTLSEIEKTKGRNAPAQMRTFSTGRRVCASSQQDGPDATAPLPRPVPRFPGLVILADGSSVRVTTTSPRHITRMTRDFTNHPLWNPLSGGRNEAEADDDMGRLGRFRRRFADDGAGHAQNSVSFDESDLSWMSGGREARPGAAVQAKKGKGGKGKK